LRSNIPLFTKTPTISKSPTHITSSLIHFIYLLIHSIYLLTVQSSSISIKMSTQTLTAEDIKLVLAVLKQIDLAQFTINYIQLAEDLGLAGGAGNGKKAASMRWVRFKKKMGKALAGGDADGKAEEDNSAGEGKVKGTPKGKKTAGGGKKRKVTEETHSDGEEEQQQQVGGGGKRRKVAGMKNNTDEEMKVKGEENLDEYWGEVADDQFYDQDQDVY
jgi:hypothetical protein